MYTYKEYVQLEAESSDRLEYNFGEVYALAGSTKRHNQICNKVMTALDLAISATACEVYSIDIKIEIIPQGRYVYPDVIVTCDPNDIQY